MKVHADNVPPEAPRLRVFMSRKRAEILRRALTSFIKVMEYSAIPDRAYFVYPVMVNKNEAEDWIKALGDALGE